MTLTIIARITQAPPRCEPLNRDFRPSLCGLLRSRIIANVARPTRHITAMKSWANPSASQCPTTGMAHSSLREKRMPKASR